MATGQDRRKQYLSDLSRILGAQAVNEELKKGVNFVRRRDADLAFEPAKHWQSSQPCIRCLERCSDNAHQFARFHSLLLSNDYRGPTDASLNALGSTPGIFSSSSASQLRTFEDNSSAAVSGVTPGCAFQAR